MKVRFRTCRFKCLNNAGLFGTKKSVLDGTDLVIQLDFPPYTWPKEAEQNFVDYINEGRGGWIGFHHATLLGEFDGYPCGSGSAILWGASVSVTTLLRLPTAR